MGRKKGETERRPMYGTRLDRHTADEVVRIAKAMRWTISQTISILVEEALAYRKRKGRP